MKVIPPGALKSVAEMQDFEMWSRDMIGATPEDHAAAERGQLSPTRLEELTCAGLAARERLAEMTVPGVQDWMSPRRICN